MDDQDEFIHYAVHEYVVGRIEVDELERAIEHILAGGIGNEEFPYLPIFKAFKTETVWR